MTTVWCKGCGKPIHLWQDTWKLDERSTLREVHYYTSNVHAKFDCIGKWLLNQDVCC